LDSYVVHMLQLAKLISRRRLNEKNLAQKLRKIRRVTGIVSDVAKSPRNQA